MAAIVAVSVLSEEEDEELDRGDSRRDHRGDAPGLERLVLDRMIHGPD
jgi:hypothetical protein